ncbi:DUF3565 domain-containing protein [Aquisalimonas sp.]|uniref:DUF3565 domain-containing protein n=1 Tax=Aquisalimonas sp. TaxID=1872621 RepID=UPI0025BC18D0|nr:DUF3565 domain-containing protein [Aquisalimonas sp.]
MRRAIIGFHTDDEDHWVADLECGHTQHVRHRPPWIQRPWVTTPEGRASMLGYRLWCKRCEDGEPPARTRSRP